jgi:hypothetical protein
MWTLEETKAVLNQSAGNAATETLMCGIAVKEMGLCHFGTHEMGSQRPGIPSAFNYSTSVQQTSGRSGLRTKIVVPQQQEVGKIG